MTYKIIEGVLSVEQDGETAILDSNNEQYYSLDEVGTLIWALLEQEATFEEIVHTVMTEYEVEQAECAEDMQQFINEMIENKLIEKQA